jgi:hypothetical protein
MGCPDLGTHKWRMPYTASRISNVPHTTCRTSLCTFFDPPRALFRSTWRRTRLLDTRTRSIKYVVYKVDSALDSRIVLKYVFYEVDSAVNAYSLSG